MNATSNPQAAAEQASKMTSQLGLLGLSTAIPEGVRALAQKTVGQTRQVYDRSSDAFDASVATFEKSFDAAGQGAAAFNRKIIDISRRNLNSVFDLAASLAGAKDLADIVECKRPIGRSSWGRSRPKLKKFARSRPRWRLPRASAQGAREARHG